MSVFPNSFNRPQPPFPIVGPPTYPTSYPPYFLPTLLPIYHTFYVPYLLPTLLPTYTPTYLPYFLHTLPPTHPTSYLSYLLPTLPPTYPESKITENSEHRQISWNGVILHACCSKNQSVLLFLFIFGVFHGTLHFPYKVKNQSVLHVVHHMLCFFGGDLFFGFRSEISGPPPLGEPLFPPEVLWEVVSKWSKTNKIGPQMVQIVPKWPKMTTIDEKRKNGFFEQTFAWVLVGIWW